MIFPNYSGIMFGSIWISKLFTLSNLTKTHLKSSNNTESQTNTMLNQEKNMFEKYNDISNSPPKRVYNETLKTHHNSVRSSI